MTDPVEKNIQIKDMQGNLCFPKTKAAIVLNNDGKNLGTVEEGAQVNIIETIKVNGEAQTVTGKAVDITVPAGYIQSSDDTATVDITVDSDAKLTADVKVSAVENNALTAKTDGLHVDISGKVDKLATKPTEGTYTKVTINAEGQVTAGTNITLADVTDVKASVSEVNKLQGLTASTDELNILKGVTADKDDINKLTDLETTTTELGYVHGVTSAIQTQIDGKVAKADIVDNLTTADATKVLSANQGKALKDICDSLSAIGRFLSVWDCTTGLPQTDPETTPYTYHAGDYYIVGVVATAEGAKNYKPTGTAYDKTASTVEETEVVAINDVYYFDGTVWKLMINSGRTVSFANIAGQPSDNANLAAALNAKVDANTAIEGATKCKITYDAKGLVTAGANLAASDIPSLELTKISDVTATAAEVNVLGGIEASTKELNYVKGVTSAVQTQLDAKVAKNADITAGTHTKITYDAKGLVTAGADLTADDIPSLALAKITDVTATAAEVNALHEAGATKADFVKLNAITATAAEVSELHEAGAVKADFAKLHAITASADELNTMKGITATTAELNIMKGVTATTAEINYLSGVTSGIQTQIDRKAAKATTLAGYGITDGLTYEVIS